MLRRLLTLRDVQQFALVVVHMEALPYLPAVFEAALSRLGVLYAYDFDDASFHQNDQHPRRLIGSGAAVSDIVDADLRPWREDAEAAEVRDFDICIMPLRDDPWSRGKCGFKLIQYLACGVPVVASPFGVKRDIVTHGETGFLCETDEEWIEKLTHLIENPPLRRVMGMRERDVIRKDWLLQRWGSELAGLLARTAGAPK
jgi:glycosyltransferase involved in cell wall biosynthesis